MRIVDFINKVLDNFNQYKHCTLVIDGVCEADTRELLRDKRYIDNVITYGNLKESKDILYMITTVK